MPVTTGTAWLAAAASPGTPSIQHYAASTLHLVHTSTLGMHSHLVAIPSQHAPCCVCRVPLLTAHKPRSRSGAAAQPCAPAPPLLSSSSLTKPCMHRPAANWTHVVTLTSALIVSQAPAQATQAKHMALLPAHTPRTHLPHHHMMSRRNLPPRRSLITALPYCMQQHNHENTSNATTAAMTSQPSIENVGA